MNLQVTEDLIILGGAASTLVEVLRALLLDIERYPRLKKLWPALPSLLGVGLVFVFPSAVPSGSDLVKAAHGFFACGLWTAAYPLLKNTFTTKLKTMLPVADSVAEKERNP